MRRAVDPNYAPLPIEAVLPEVVATLEADGLVVLQAPPGAGKTTMVPVALFEAGFAEAGRIFMLEPRRLAARGAAERLASNLCTEVGKGVGYRMRGEAKVSRETRIEVVTEGILTRMIQSDPELTGISTVIFDEFHERSLQADLGLALALEAREALRPDLKIAVMSATLDAAPVAELMGGARVVTSEGRSFPVEEHWAEAPLPAGARLEGPLADLVLQALAETEGDMLVFLPGEGEIRRTAAALAPRLPKGAYVAPLYGAMPFAEQRKAIAPAPGGPNQQRKIVLATSIAETSLTIPGIRSVVDAGRARRARFDPGTGMSRLVTEPVSRAEATQRTGRAGRVEAGRVYRLWTKGGHGALPAFPPAEIEAADLTGLVLELALWGGGDGLRFLTPPPEGAMASAERLLEDLGALQAGRITERGKALATLPVHPRLGHMLAVAGPSAAPLAALLGERDPMRSAGADLSKRLKALANPGTAPDAARATLKRIGQEAKRLARLAGPASDLTEAQALALAYPDRIGLRRPGDAPRFLLSGGRGAQMGAEDDLAGQRLIVVADIEGEGRDARIRLALPISESELRAVPGISTEWHDVAEWSKRERRVVARRQERLGALVLDDRHWKDAPDDALAVAALDGIRDLGLPVSAKARRLVARADLMPDLPDCSEEALLAKAEDWLLPWLGKIRTAADIAALDITEALKARIGWEGMQALDRAAPPSFTTPLGRAIPIDYSGEAPEISLRLQEMFGQTSHPTVAGQPLRVTLLSPAGRPVQTTMDIPGFWASSYADVRKDMRGRYPKHPWPEDPTVADPTLRAKPRK
ncbi:ATP-dependent helicase HrpB [Vannielia litorea]|uniref:ATP-dependent helicase HrpB n=1 Tax=Vannielia litorea TaxID=1217970 RepID=UPI001C976B24|nr:ATP-dependent helicase HrpB [Vannielia litorea]MBY6046251.1 ATP-dependent helicase HrpB [Vannielia litorea]MBY6073664.1 ATP-dependent helicase HrpB [Vannielia litorea]